MGGGRHKDGNSFIPHEDDAWVEEHKDDVQDSLDEPKFQVENVNQIGQVEKPAEKPAPPRKRGGKLVYNLFIGAGLALMVYLYVFSFDHFSETELMKVSFFWLPLILFGLGGRYGVANRKKFPFLTAFFTALLGSIGLFLFFEVMWRSL